MLKRTTLLTLLLTAVLAQTGCGYLAAAGAGAAIGAEVEENNNEE